MRDQFLKHIWQPYPALTIEDYQKLRRQELYCGRIVDLCQKTGRISITFNDQNYSFLLQAEQPFFLTQTPVWSVLVPGDIVLIEPCEQSQRIQLLVPSLTSWKFVKNWQAQKKWQAFVQTVRQFFMEHDFIEIQTPFLVPSGAVEPHLETFQSEWKSGSRSHLFDLPTSPEIHLKKSLCYGAQNIFEIKSCFRNEEKSQHHRPEFTMLEWYRAYAPLESIMEDCRKLLTTLGVNNIEIVQVSVQELFHQHLQFELKPSTEIAELHRLAKASGIRSDMTDSWNDVFFRLFLDKIEPNLPKDQIILVHSYPPSQSAMARIGADGWSERFEIYWQGLEIANAYHELNDTIEQQKRLEIWQNERKSLNRQAHRVDAEFFEALNAGMPPSSGIALGMERLFMALHNINDIYFVHLT